MQLFAFLFLALGVAPLQNGEAKVDHPKRLREAVMLSSPEARSQAAKRLAQDRNVDLDQWLECMATFGTFPSGKKGRLSLQAKLWVDGKSITRNMELFVPSAYDPAQPMSLMFLLHGSGGTGLQMLPGWERLAEQQGYLLLAPTALNSDRGYSFTQAERDTALEALRWMRLRYNVDENHIHVHGVSRGGHLTWDLGLRHRDRFASLIPAIGGPTWIIEEGRNNMRYMENLWDMPIRDLQGSRDDFRMLRNLRRAFERLEAVGNINAHLVEFEDLGHNFRTDTIDWAGFVENSDRTPLPGKLMVRAARGDNQRTSWIRVDRVDRSVREVFPLTVRPAAWNALDEAGKARFVLDSADSNTGQVTAERSDDGSFKIEMDGIKQVSLLLPKEWIPEGRKVLVSAGRGNKKLTARISKQVLLQDFVERFDRQFLPVAAIAVKR